MGNWLSVRPCGQSLELTEFTISNISILTVFIVVPSKLTIGGGLART